MLGSSTNNTASKVFGITVCLAIAAYSCYQLYASDKKILHLANIHEENRKPSIEHKSSPEKEHTLMQDDPSSKNGKGVQLTEADLASVGAWDERIGYISKEDALIYEGYDENTLNVMLKNGDAHAAKALADKYVKKGDLEQAKLTYWKSAALGATSSLGDLALLNEPASFTEMDMPERKEKIIEVMATLKLAELRADLRTAVVVGKVVKLNFEANFGPLNFDENEKAQISLRAKELYVELQKNRYESGLGEFDNETPTIIKHLYAH